jgi:prephenate dehydrogenase
MRILIYGGGIIGGSIAKALVLQGFEVFCVNRTPLFFDGIKFFQSVEDLPNLHFDIICVAVPRGRNYEIYQDAFGKIKNLSCDFLVDCSSVQNQNEYLRGYFRGKFIPCHPIAGSEKVGFENSDAKILESKTCIVIGANPPQKVLDFWHACKMTTRIIATTQQHDEIYAAVSHLPQLISFFLPEPREPYTEFYRLRTSSREIWDEIFVHNYNNIAPLFGDCYHFLSFQDTDYLEKLIGNMFLECTNREFVQFSGTGFRTITMFADDGVIMRNRNESLALNKNISDLSKILQNAENYLVGLKKSHKQSSITL